MRGSYPRMFRVGSCLRKPLACATIVIGIVTIATYVWYMGQITRMSSIGRSDNAFPVDLPMKSFVSALLAWSFLWCAEAMTRPYHRTIVAALGFLLFLCLFVVPLESRAPIWIRE